MIEPLGIIWEPLGTFFFGAVVAFFAGFLSTVYPFTI
jgi:hypothetical protein